MMNSILVLLADPYFRLISNFIIAFSSLYIVWRLVAFRSDDGQLKFSRSAFNYVAALIPLGMAGNAINVGLVYFGSPGRVSIIWGLPTPAYYSIGDLVAAVPFVVMALVMRKYENIKLAEIGRILFMSDKEILAQLDQQKAANEQLRHYLDVISHELRVPFTGIIGLVEILQADMESGHTVNDDDMEVFDELVSIATSSYRMLTGLIEYTRMVRGQPPERRPQDLGKLLGEVIRSLRAEVERSGAIILWEAESFPTLVCTPYISQVFSNLIRNAIKYQPEGRPPEITITATEHATHWAMAVEDNGIGFNMRNLGRVFAPLRSAHADLGGSGVGLPMSRLIVERNGGELEAYSEENHGSTFRFTIPKL